MSSLTRGESLDTRFTLVRPLGRGGSGEVWLVRDEELGEQVVAKILPTDASEQRVELLRRECRNARRLVHPGIARVFDFHRSPRGAFITMAWVDGDDLRSWRGRDVVTLVRGMLPVAAALRYAHGLGVVHRDLKPSNVVVDSEGNAHLLDFGIACFGVETDGIRGGGSRAYAGPQQLAGVPPSPSDDLYGFGALLFDLITRQPPTGEAQGVIPGRLGSLVERLLAKDPAARPRGMDEVEEELRAILREQEGRVAAGASGRTGVVPPPRVRPIRPRLQAAKTARPAPRRFPLGRASATVLLVSLTALALFALPSWLPERAPTVAAPPDVTVLEPEAAEAESSLPGSLATDDATGTALRDRLRSRTAAEEALDAMRIVADALDDRGVAVWGGEAYRAASGLVAEADAALAAGSYDAAAGLYREAEVALAELLERSDVLFQEAVERGLAALAAGDALAASEAFERALAIDAENEAALDGRDRAAVLDRVLERLAAGRRAERAGDLRRAETEYARALELDRRSEEARTGLERVRIAARDEQFRERMSEGLASLERGDHEAARQAFESAGAIRPDSDEVPRALANLVEAEKLDAIGKYRDRAEESERDEDWGTALQAFEAVLELDPTLVFAQQGASRSRIRAELARRIDYHLDHPERLADDAVLDDAREVLGEADAVEPAGPRLRAARQELRRLIRTASTPVTVRLESDGMTEVTVYRVGRLGTFDLRELELRPGRYTVIGSREGFRDVRHELVVEAGAVPEPLVVRCEEPI